MRKLKLQMQISIDGFVSAGSNDDQSWVTWAWDEIKLYVLGLIDTTDTIVIGRKLAVDYIPHWQNVVENPRDQMHELALRIVRARKVIFSKSLEKSDWDNTKIVSGNLAEEINNLKKENGKDIIVYGGSSFVSSLIREKLIDEFHFFVNPVALGNGVPIFDKLEYYKKLKLKRSIRYECVIVLLNYENC
jgi:dihydrofolate reductase